MLRKLNVMRYEKNICKTNEKLTHKMQPIPKKTYFMHILYQQAKK